MMETFKDFIARVHPDPDSLLDRNSTDVFDQFCILAEAYASSYYIYKLKQKKILIEMMNEPPPNNVD